MTNIRATLKSLGLTQDQAARLLGVTDRTMRRYVKDGPTGPAARLLWLLAFTDRRNESMSILQALKLFDELTGGEV